MKEKSIKNKITFNDCVLNSKTFSKDAIMHDFRLLDGFCVTKPRSISFVGQETLRSYLSFLLALSSAYLEQEQGERILIYIDDREDSFLFTSQEKVFNFKNSFFEGFMLSLSDNIDLCFFTRIVCPFPSSVAEAKTSFLQGPYENVFLLWSFQAEDEFALAFSQISSIVIRLLDFSDDTRTSVYSVTKALRLHSIVPAILFALSSPQIQIKAKK